MQGNSVSWIKLLSALRKNSQETSTRMPALLMLTQRRQDDICLFRLPRTMLGQVIIISSNIDTAYYVPGNLLNALN